VSEELAGERVATVITAPEYSQSGAYWSWGNRQKKDGKSFVQKVSLKQAMRTKRSACGAERKLVGLAISDALHEPLYEHN